MPTSSMVWKRTDLLWLAFLLFPSLLLCGMSLQSGEFWWTDESRHAMNGVFILDFVRDMPWRAPMDYALRYFAQYPALALNWYPPGFYAVEAVFFGVFGLSETTGHLTVLVFTGLGLTALFVWVAGVWGRPTALLAGLLLASSPAFVFWSRSLMLDAPAMAMTIVSTYLFDRYLATPGWRTATLSGIALAAMLLLKQSTVFLLPALLGYALLTGRGSRLIAREAIVAWVLTGAALGFLVVHLLKFGGNALASAAGALEVTAGNDALPAAGQGLRAAGGTTPTLSWARWTLYPRTLLEQLGWPFLIAALTGVWVALRRARKAQDVLLLLWLVSWYLMVTLMFTTPGNTARYTIYAMPALAALACRGADLLPWRTWHQGIFCLLAGIAMWHSWHAFQREPLFVSGYREAALHLLADAQRGTILFAGKHDGNLIFHLRANDPERKRVVIRADKTLVTMTVHKYFGMRSHVGSVEEVQALLDRYKVTWVVLERPDIVGVKEFELLWQVVNGPQFHLERDIPVTTNVADFHDLHILMFRRTDANLGPGTVRIPVMGREIDLNL